MFYFGALFAFLPVLLTFMWWFRWPHPLSFGDKIVLVGFALISLPSGMFLLTAKSTTPSDNQERLKSLFWALFLVQIALQILSVRR